MGMPHAPSRWTAAAVRNLPDDGRRYELVDGELVVTPAPSWIHQGVAAALFHRIHSWLATTRLGVIRFSPADIALGEDEILQPDLFVVPAGDQAPILQWTDINRLLLAIEILSPSTARFDRLLKRRRYQRAGVPEYWIVDPDARLIERWRPEDTRPEVVGEILTWQPDPLQPALEIDLVAMFAEAWGN
jgi:Uma2 family endonuclease